MSLKDLQESFFQDPRWLEMEDLILKYINPLLEMDTIDTSQTAENVKAEIIGRKLAYKSLRDFLDSTKVVSKSLKELKNNFD